MKKVEAPQGQREHEFRIVVLDNKETKVDFEPELWHALDEICCRERTNFQSLCTTIDLIRPADLPIKTAIILFILDYFRVAATEEGHLRVNHGAITQIEPPPTFH